MKDTDRQILEGELERELNRDDSIGRAERRAAVKRQLTLLDTISELARDSHDNYAYLLYVLDNQADGDDQRENELMELALDGPTIDALVNIIYAGDSQGNLITTSRLEYTVLPALKQFWDSKHKQHEDLYRPLGWNDDINLQDLNGWQLEAKCGLCGQMFTPLKESFVGLNNQQMGLYEHYLKVVEKGQGIDKRTGEVHCGGYGLITGGYKGMEKKQV